MNYKLLISDRSERIVSCQACDWSIHSRSVWFNSFQYRYWLGATKDIGTLFDISDLLCDFYRIMNLDLIAANMQTKLTKQRKWRCDQQILNKKLLQEWNYMGA